MGSYGVAYCSDPVIIVDVKLFGTMVGLMLENGMNGNRVKSKHYHYLNFVK